MGLCVRFHCPSTGGLNEFGVLHPSLCEVSVPSIKKSCLPTPRASTPGELSRFWVEVAFLRVVPKSTILTATTASFSEPTIELVVVMWPYDYMYIGHVTMQLNLVHVALRCYNGIQCIFNLLSSKFPSCVAVPGRNWTLFCCIFWSHYRVQSAVVQNFRWGWGSYALGKLTMFTQHVWAPPLGEVQHYSTSNAVMRLKYTAE